MSRNLPDRPSLEHLRKQAKTLLDELRTKHPATKLADALHAVAKEHGFGTWPQLKAHVASVSDAPTSDVSPLTGTWIAGRHTLSVSIDNDAVAIVAIEVDDAGRTSQSRHVVRAGAGRQPVDGSAGFFTDTRWHGTRSLEVLAMKDDESIGRVVYSVSVDDRSLTVESSARPHDGYSPEAQTVVFMRR